MESTGAMGGMMRWGSAVVLGLLLACMVMAGAQRIWVDPTGSRRTRQHTSWPADVSRELSDWPIKPLKRAHWVNLHRRWM